MADSLRAVVFTGIGQLEIQEFPLPPVPGGKVLVKIESCGLCTAEQRIYTGAKKMPFPYIGGHEMSGTIVDMGVDVDKKQWHTGDHVVVGVTFPCGNCHQCKAGNEQNCTDFSLTKEICGLPHVGMGGLSSHMIVHPRNLFQFYNTSFNEATMAEPLSCVVHSVESAGIQFGETALVLGCGVMGMFHAMLSNKRGASVIVSDINEERLALARKMGAHYTVNPQKESLPEAVRAITRGLMAQAVFNTTPIAALADDAMECLSNNARLVFYSSCYPDRQISCGSDWLHKSGVKLIGSANSNTQDFVKATRMLSEGIVPVGEFISEVYKLDDVKAAFESSVKADKYRVLVNF